MSNIIVFPNRNQHKTTELQKEALRSFLNTVTLNDLQASFLQEKKLNFTQNYIEEKLNLVVFD